MEQKAVLQAKNLCKYYEVDKTHSITACSQVNFTLHKGETIGIVGESGCGKSTVLRMLASCEKPSSGSILYQGKDIVNLKGAELRNHYSHIQMVFQDPSLAFYQRMKVRDILGEPLKNYGGLSRREREVEIKRLLQLVELPEGFINRYPPSMSGGQRQRLGIARALATNPDVLICDEATCALDVLVQDKIMKLLVEIQMKTELAIVFVCHDLALVKSISHKMMIMYLGNVVEMIQSEKLEEAKHPYTRALLQSLFYIDMEKEQEIHLLEGEVPSAINLPIGCPFASRCKECMPICEEVKPEWKRVGEGNEVACHR